MNHDVALCQDGADAADYLLRRCFHRHVEKALDPLKSADFVRLSNRIARALQRSVGQVEQRALTLALKELQADWPGLTENQRSALIKNVNRTLVAVVKNVLPRAMTSLTRNADGLVETSRRSAIKRFALNISPTMNDLDRRIVRFMIASQSNFIRDEFGRRANDFSRQARKIVAGGLERGLGRQDIGDDLRATLGPRFDARRTNYWQVVANSFANRGRSFASLSAFSEAKIRTFRYEAILDEATADVCRFLHGNVFSTASGLQTFADTERRRNPESIIEVTPWVSSGTNDAGEKELFFERAGERVVVARILRSDEGARDKTGHFDQAMNETQLQANGLTIPPLHAMCRSTIVAV